MIAALGLVFSTQSAQTVAGETSAEASVSLVFVGDLMLDREPGRIMLGGTDPLGQVAAILDGADFTIGNLCCVIATGGRRADKFFTFRADPRAVTYIARHFDAVSLANNHSGDFGPDALTETIDRLKKANVRPFGAGRNRVEAHQPWIAEKNGVRVAVLGYNEFWPRAFEAGPTTPGCAWSVDEQVVADIKAARASADVVIAFNHWGEEDPAPPTDRQRALAHKMIDAGAGVVIGNCHPHAVAGPEMYKGKLIVYGLGNFLIDEYKGDVIGTPPVLKEEKRVGWAVRLTVNKLGLVDWQTLVTRTDDEGIPHPVAGVSGPAGKADVNLEIKRSQ